MSTLKTSNACRSRVLGESVLDNDSDSDRAILAHKDGKEMHIVKTTQVTVSEEVEASKSKVADLSPKRSHDWSEPKADNNGHYEV
jgi:hypothetical protein